MAIEIQIRKNTYSSGVAEVDKALKKLKRVMTTEGILRDLRDRQYYSKPSEKKRKKSAQARARVRKENRMRDRGIM